MVVKPKPFKVRLPKTVTVKPYIRVKGGVKLVKGYFRAKPQRT